MIQRALAALAAYKSLWIGLAMVLAIAGMGLYLLDPWARPPLDEAAALVEAGKHEEALVVLGRHRRSRPDAEPAERLRAGWLLALATLRLNQQRASLTAGDIRDLLVVVKKADEEFREIKSPSAEVKKTHQALVDLWVETTLEFRGVHGHSEAIPELERLAASFPERHSLLLERARLELERPGRRPETAFKVIEQYLARKLAPAERRAGLVEIALAHQKLAEEAEVPLAGEQLRVAALGELLAAADRAIEHYDKERAARERLLKEAPLPSDAVEARFEKGRIAWRVAQIRSKLLRYRQMRGGPDREADPALRRQVEAALDLAAQELKPFVQASKDTLLRSRALYMLGESERLRGRFDEALKAYQRLEELAEKPPWESVYLALLGKARLALEKSEWTKLEGAVPKLEELATGGADFQYELAGLLERYHDARLAEMEETKRKEVETARRRALAAADVEAIERTATQAARRFSDAWTAKAAEQLLGGSRAKSTARAADAAHRALVAFSGLKNLVAAIQAADRFLEAGREDPRVSQVLQQKGDLLREIGLAGDAILAYRQNVERFPNSPFSYWSLLGLGLAHLARQETAVGLEIFARIRKDTRFDPGTPVWREALLEEATARFQVGIQPANPDRAHLFAATELLREFAERYADHPRQRSARLQLGLARLALGQPEEAARAFEPLASEPPAPPSDPQREAREEVRRASHYLHPLAYLRAIRGRSSPPTRAELAAAIDLLETAIERYDQAPAALWAASQLVELYHAEGRDPAARAAGRRALWLAEKQSRGGNGEGAFWRAWIDWKSRALLGDPSAPRRAPEGPG